MDDIREVTRRLEILERRHRRLQVLLVLIAIGAAALLLMGQAPGQVNPAGQLRMSSMDAKQDKPPQEKNIRAEAFTLVDEKGNEHASLVSDGTGSVFLVMFDTNGKPRADFQVNNYGPSLNFYDPNGKTRVAIGSTTLVASHVNSNGIVERNTPSSIVLFDGGGQLLWRTP
jgi:hypothetical protein